MYKRLAHFFFRMTFSHVHYLSKFEKKNAQDQTIYKYNLLKKHELYYLIVRLFTETKPYSNLFISILSSSQSLSSRVLTASRVKITFFRSKIEYTFRTMKKIHTESYQTNLLSKEIYFVKKTI